MPNPWISHVKSYAQEKGMKYRDALKDPDCSASYKSGKGLEPPLRNMTRYGRPKTENGPIRGVPAPPKASVNSVTY